MEERAGRGGAFLLVSPLLGPLPTRASRGEDGGLDAAMTADLALVKPPPGGHRADGRLEKFLRDERRHDCAQDHHRHQYRVLPLVNDVVLETEQRRDRAES